MDTHEQFIYLSKHLVLDYTKELMAKGKIPHQDIGEDNIYVVWSCKTLQNSKALLGTNLNDDGRYYESTYDGDNKKVYFDSYKKELNKPVSF